MVVITTSLLHRQTPRYDARYNDDHDDYDGDDEDDDDGGDGHDEDDDEYNFQLKASEDITRDYIVTSTKRQANHHQTKHFLFLAEKHHHHQITFLIYSSWQQKNIIIIMSLLFRWTVISISNIIIRATIIDFLEVKITFWGLGEILQLS